MRYTYLLIDFFTIVVPFIFSFHPKLNFYKTWKAFFIAVAFTGLVFILWDVYFTDLGVWGFNPDYLLGNKIANLPIEEILFFVCIPYSCVFTYHCLDIFIKEGLPERAETIITPTLIFLFITAAFIYHNKIYPLVTFIGLSILLLTSKYLLKITWLAKFYIIYAVLLFPFLIVNGLLTGTGLDAPVVWYNESEIIGVRIMTIPVEDVFYGMALILMNLMIYQFLKSNPKKSSLKV